MPGIDQAPAEHGAAAPRSNQRVLITGAAGFLGSELVRQGIAAGHDVCAVVRPGSVAPRLAGVDVAVHAADLRDPTAVARLIDQLRPDLVVHAAANPGHATTAAQRLDAWADNTLGTAHLLEGLVTRPDAVLVHVGASTEYGPSPLPLREDHPVSPLTLRGVTKRAATMAVRQWAAALGRRAVVVRPFSIYGPREQPTKLVPTLLRCAATGETFPTLAATSRRDLVHVADVAEGCFRASTLASSASPVLNLGTGVEHSVDEVLLMVQEATGRTIATSPGSRAPQTHDVEHWVADTTMCRQLLGWVPATSLRDGLAGLVEEFAA